MTADLAGCFGWGADVFRACDLVRTRDPQTLLLTAADSDGSGLQLLCVAPDGIEGANTRAFVAEADAQLPYRPLPNLATELQPVPAQPLLFAIAWPGFSDFAGGILSRAEGLNADWLRRAEPFAAGEPPLRQRFDNTDVYRLLYKTLFGVRLPSRVGVEAETR
ncbi:hypothetical protein CCR96_11845 [Halochromatium roseum]|nr:hypothetical protein [Halochromatium roseum]